MGEPADLPSLAIFPSYTVGLNAIYLLEQEGLYTGPNMNIAKLFNITTLQAQYATAITENEPDVEMPNYYGINAVVTVADVIKKLGGDPGEFLLVFNPALGYSGGWRTKGAGFDHGPVINVVNADLEKLCRLLGLCK